MIEHEQASASLLQRKLNIGFAEASSLIDEMERRGYITGSEDRAAPRKFLVTKGWFSEF